VSEHQEIRCCPNCGKERPPTGGAFCNSYCWQIWVEGRTEEFEADVSVMLWLVQTFDEFEIWAAGS